MFDLFHLTLEVEPVHGDFFLYCVSPSGQILLPDIWKDALFLWHEQTYYGSEATQVEINGKKGILLSAWQMFTFIQLPIQQHVLKPALSASAEAYQQIAVDMTKRIIQGKFHSLPLKKQMTGSLSQADEQEWRAQIKESLLKKEGKDFLISIEGESYNPPFDLSLRIVEPTTDGDVWTAETFVIPHDEAKEPFILGRMLPKEWNHYESYIAYEHERWKALAPTLYQKGAFIQSVLTDEEVWEFLTQDSAALIKQGVSIHLPSWWESLKKATIKVSGTIENTSSALFGKQAISSFRWSFSIGDQTFSEEEFRKLVEQKRRLLSISGQWIQLDSRLIKQAQKIVKEASKKGVSIHEILKTKLTYMADSKTDEEEVKVEFQLPASFQSFITSLTDLERLPEVLPPSEFKGALRPYQQQGLNWLMFLRKFNLGGCLADDMGLGKTIQLISYLTNIHPLHSSPSLIVCPTSLIGNWEKELQKFAPSLRVHVHYGPKRTNGYAFEKICESTDVVITTYQVALLDVELLKGFMWNSISLDEAQHVKNPQTKQARAIRQLQGRHKIALTGTPIENRLLELWSLFEFINPGYLGTINSFKNRFVAGIEKGEKPERTVELKALIQPFLLRRTKQDKNIARSLPDKQEQKEYIPLTAEQASLYQELVQGMFQETEEKTGFERKGIILQTLNKLKLLCNHPALYLKESAAKQTVRRSHKSEKIIELVESIRTQQESCLIFTQYIETGLMLQRTLEKEINEPVLFLHGSLSKEQRDEMVAQFQARNKAIFILSLRAGGTGLNLTAANHVIHFDRWWNPAVENQATDRAHRIGQNKFVHVHKFITRGTIEEKIDEVINQKQHLNNELIQGDQWVTELSNKELQELLAYRNE
ncbi:DEAD/DEAH box helicase [Priestia megaterium]|uniref:DEAD/DEAH box helicase n=1 Tax=Priestia megaterium TaxID=1404 RepID=UPI002E206A9F|nr:DEAD/DEAH box helicase [Priestia megaterium]